MLVETQPPSHPHCFHNQNLTPEHSSSRTVCWKSQVGIAAGKLSNLLPIGWR